MIISAFWSAMVVRRLGAGIGIVIFLTGILIAALGIYFGNDWFIIIPPISLGAYLGIRFKKNAASEVCAIFA
jgi:hypothetical protein